MVAECYYAFVMKKNLCVKKPFLKPGSVLLWYALTRP